MGKGYMEMVDLAERSFETSRSLISYYVERDARISINLIALIMIKNNISLTEIKETN